MKKQERKIGLVMAILMSAAMGILASIVIHNDPKAQTPPFPIFCLINLAESIVVGLLVAIAVPLGKIGQAITKKAKAVPPSLKYNLLNSIPMAIGNSVIVSAIVSFIGVAQGRAKMPPEQAPPLLNMWLGSWGPLLIPSIIVSYVLAIVLSPIVAKAVLGKGKGPGPGKEEKR